MFEDVFKIDSYANRIRQAGAGPIRVNSTLSFREDMYSLLYISMVKPIYMKYCERNTKE